MKQRGWLKAIAVWQITGGILGGVVFLDAIPRIQAPSDAKWALFAPAIALCALSVLAGWALLKGRRAARTPSLIVHAVQLIGIGTSEVTFRVVLGPYLFFYVAGSGFGVNAGFTPQLHWHTGGPMPFEPHIVVNLLALTCISLLLRWRYLTELVSKQRPPSPVEAPPKQSRSPIGWPPINWP